MADILYMYISPLDPAICCTVEDWLCVILHTHYIS